MLGGLRRRRQSLHSRTGSSLRRRNDFELVLWGVPLAMVGVSSFLILSIERRRLKECVVPVQLCWSSCIHQQPILVIASGDSARWLWDRTVVRELEA